jgi:hypothetical protein
MISVLLQAAPARAQERQPDSEAQPPPTAEDSPPPSPASQGEAPSPPAAPEAPAAEEKDPASPLGGLEELLQEDVPTASVGSFGYRLRRYGIAPYVHGALAVDLWRVRQQEEGEPYYQGFDLRDAHLYFGADILDLIVPELFVEFEADEPGQSALFLRYAQIDVRLHEQLFVMRAGLFLIPFGIFNTESFPRFIAKLPDRAKFYDEVTPVPWREVGIQFLGRWEWRPGLSLSYAVSLTNGMEQPDIDDPADPTDDGVDEGGSLGNLQNVFEEVNNSKKSLGGRVRLEFLPGLAVGLSGYTGAYTTHGARRLSSVGLDVSFSRGNLSLELETALARQEVTGGALTKWGYVAIAAYRLHPMVEPVLAVDEVRLDGDPEEDERTYWAGLNVFPFPDQIPTALFKAAYSGSIHGDHFVHHQLSVQFVVGF